MGVTTIDEELRNVFVKQCIEDAISLGKQLASLRTHQPGGIAVLDTEQKLIAANIQLLRTKMPELSHAALQRAQKTIAGLTARVELLESEKRRLRVIDRRLSRMQAGGEC